MATEVENNEEEKPDAESFQPTLYVNDIKPEDAPPEDGQKETLAVPVSTVHLESNRGKRYQMTFKAKDPEFYFLYVHRRKSPDGSTQKASQACSTDYFVEVRDLRCQKFVMRMKRYRIASCSQSIDGDNNEEDSVQASKPSKIGKHRNKDTETLSHIYVEKDGILFLLTANFVQVEIAQTFQEEPLATEIQTSTEYKKGTYNSEPNRASLVARVNKDLMRVRFVLDEMEIKPISVYVSRGAQCSERYAYVKFVPESGNKVAFCAVPLSTYMYRDPMMAVRRKNDARRRIGLDPKWLVEERKKRLQQTAAHMTQSQESPEATRSVIVFELNGHRVKLRCGHMTASLIDGGDVYDDFVLSNKTEQRLLIRSPNTAATDSI
ncbi:unnamed protein product [Calicophoron daubneyi]|uniref:Sin1 middle CRIM domain-containing protein n=1 Tax=Calicophoron daubneyi TaxID=300641 RepID=A0AAV2T335_CALDB